MNNFVICLDRMDQVLCWGDMYLCEKYIEQLNSISIQEVTFKNYSINNNYSCYYEDYEVYNIEGTNVYLTLGEIDLIRNGCQDDMRGIRYIEEEINHLLTLNHIYNNSIMEELLYMKSFMQEIYQIRSRYNMDNVFDNLDIDALHSSYQIERENKGLPIVFI